MPPFCDAVEILPMPPPGIGTQRSRGIESIVTDFVLGSTRTRIIDCVLYLSATNFESSSEPRSSTVKGSVGPAMVIGFKIPPGEFTTGVVEDWKRGKKYAPSPIRAASKNPRTMNEALGSRDTARSPDPERTLRVEISLMCRPASTQEQRVDLTNALVAQPLTRSRDRSRVELTNQ